MTVRRGAIGRAGVGGPVIRPAVSGGSIGLATIWGLAGVGAAVLRGARLWPVLLPLGRLLP